MSDSFSWPIFLSLLAAYWVASFVTLLARRAQTAHAARELEASSALRTIADSLDELGQLGVLRSAS